MRILFALLFAASIPAVAQKVEVPAKLDFADMTLIIRDDARKEIQKDVDALTASPRHYQIKVERARTYFPIIEKIFREENLPDDFKYLVLQESALIPDAVSTSNAVGFWQFKDFTGIEMGLRIDKDIDERMNIASSTRAAARYLKKNYQYFNNWLYALQAYQMGAGGVMRAVKDTEPNARRMEITSKTYWYVKKFLAHKIAYEGSVSGTPQKQLVAYENRGRNSIQRIARETGIGEEDLQELNKWAKSGHIPDDRPYLVLLPVEASATAIAAETTVDEINSTRTARAVVPAIFGKINGVRTIQAVEGDDLRRLVARAGVDYRKFLKWNDLPKDHSVVPGQVYFLGKKRLKGSENFHKRSAGESLWAISQRYGLRLSRLKRYNRLRESEVPPAGTMLYLASRKPREFEQAVLVEDAVEVDEASTFAWEVKTEPGPAPAVTTVPAVVTPAAQDEISASTHTDIPVSADTNVADSGETLQEKETEAEIDSATSDLRADVVPPDPVVEETVPEKIQAFPKSGQHVVQPGETLYGIARSYGLKVMDLVEWNGLSLEAGIKPGQVIRLAGHGDTPSESQSISTGEGFYHEVKTSDTLYSIARKYNVTIKDIMDWNEKKDFTLSVGEKLKIMRSR